MLVNGEKNVRASAIDLLHKQYFTYDQALKASEDWSERTKKMPSFKKLISVQSKFELAMRKHWKQLSENTGEFVNWASYSAEAVKTAATKSVEVTDSAGNTLVLPIDSSAFVNEKTALMNIMQEYILASAALGIADANELYVDSGLSASSEAVIKVATDRSAKLVTNITETTRNRIQQSISTSLQLGENIDEATSRLSDTIDDPYRAEMIARTETRNSYVEGQNTVANATGATSKVWDASSNPCPLCEENAEAGEIPVNDDFPNGDEPHPNCLCGSPIYNYPSGDQSTDPGSSDISE